MSYVCNFTTLVTIVSRLPYSLGTTQLAALQYSSLPRSPARPDDKPSPCAVTFVSRRRPGRTSAAFPPSRCHLHLLSLSLFSVQRTSVKPDRPISEAHAEPTTVSYRTHTHTLSRPGSPGRPSFSHSPFSPLRLRIPFGNADTHRTTDPPRTHSVDFPSSLQYLQYN